MDIVHPVIAEKTFDFAEFLTIVNHAMVECIGFKVLIVL